MPDIPCPAGAVARGGHGAGPDAPALIARNECISYRAYDAAAVGAVERLREAGIQPCDFVAVAAAPCVDYLVLLLGLWRLGAIACPLNPRFPANLIRQALRNLDCRVLAVSEPLELERVRVVSLSGLGLRRGAGSREAAAAMLDTSRAAAVVQTSGSGSAPKAALLSYGNLYYGAVASAEALELTPGDRWLLSLPLYHVSGLGIVFRCMAAGAAVAIPGPDEPLAEAAARCGATHLSLVPAQLHRLLQDADAVQALARTKAILLGGAPAAPGLLRQAWDAGLPIRTSYGLTETAALTTVTRADDPPEALLTAGRPIRPGTVSISCAGEVLVGGDAVFQGYIREGDLLRTLTPRGHFATGDLGHFDANGRLVVTGRRDNQFITGGENIQPEALEHVLCQLESVAEAIVVPVPDSVFGATPAAFVRITGGAPPDGPALAAALVGELPRYMVPRYWFPWPEPSEPGALKPDRQELAQLAQRLLKPSE